MVIEKIVAGPLGVNCYIIGCEKTGIGAVIDPGDSSDIILKTLNDKNLKATYILLTHGHVDHLAHLNRIKEKTNATLIMHKEDSFLLHGLSAQAFMFGLPDPGKIKPDQIASDNYVLSIGQLNLKILHTPGHSPGSISFYVENHIFVGDLIFQGSIGRTDLPGGNYEKLISSVESKIFTLPPDTIIYPGHGPSTTVEQEKSTNPFF